MVLRRLATSDHADPLHPDTRFVSHPPIAKAEGGNTTNGGHRRG
jgi:hypothetical protein